MKFNIQGFVKSRMFTKILWGLGILLVLLVVFRIGMFVGFYKATFAHNFGERYYRGFEGKEQSRFLGMPTRGFPDAHGATGKVLSVGLPLIMIADNDGIEKVIRVGEDTEVRRFRDRINANDISVGSTAIVIGEPNENGEVEARLIRLFPSSVAPVTPNTSSTQPILPVPVSGQ